MTQEDNVKLAEWAGYTDIYINANGDIYGKESPEDSSRMFINGGYGLNSSAISLLPVMVEKGHGALLTDDGCKRWDFTIWVDMAYNEATETVDTIEAIGKTSISEAITSAITALINRKEQP